MNVLELLKQALRTCGSIIKFGAGIQEQVRKDLVGDLQQICLNCEQAYSTVLKRLERVKNAMQDSSALSKELRALAADSETRDAFKPEHLCGEIDQLLVKLSSNLDPVKYAVDFTKLGELRQSINMVGNYDEAIYASYDEFARHLDTLATQIDESGGDPERRRYGQHVIREFERDLRSAVDAVRDVKKNILDML